mmetsp:Transcript_84495/g.243965  ORF Transcript_84495/g.243965 Transcript_84495/m.243965 type:complete len:309 (-) Transcript_84495:331-1257(-)
MGVHARELAKGAVPIGDGHHTAVPRAPPLGRHKASGDPSVDADAALPVIELATLQWVVVRRAWLVDRAAIVRGKHEQAVFPHAFGLQSLDDIPNGLIHPERHRGVESPILRVDFLPARGDRQGVDPVEVGRRHLQRRVEQVERVEQEQRRAGVVGADNFQGPVLEQLFLVTLGVRLRFGQALRRSGGTVPRTTAVRLVVLEEVHEAVQAIVDLARGLKGGVDTPVVVGMLEVTEPSIVAPAVRRVLRCGHACVPLADHVCAVARLAKLLRHSSHVPRNAGETADGVRSVRDGHARIHGVHVDRQAPRL